MLFDEVLFYYGRGLKAHQKLSSKPDNSLIERLLLAEAETFLSELNHCLKAPKESLFSELKGLLEKRWHDIQGSPFSYTCMPNHYISKLCKQIAQSLHRRDGNMLVYQYMMPSIEHTSDKVLYLKASLDDYELDELIVADDRLSLIPAVLATRLSHRGNVPFSSLVNLYSQSMLTPSEVKRLTMHSENSNRLVSLFNEIQSLKRGSTALGGKIQQLILTLYAGGKSGQTGGTESEASIVALNGMIAFMGYWRLLSLKDKEAALLLKNKQGDKTLGEIINILIKEDSDALDCVEINAEVLESILEHNQERLFNFKSANGAYLEGLIKEFDALKNELSIGTHGFDRTLEFSYGLMERLHPLDLVNSLNDVFALLTLMPSSSVEQSQTRLKEILLSHLPSAEQFSRAFAVLPEKVKTIVFDILKDNMDEILVSGKDVSIVFKQLNLVQRAYVFERIKNNVTSTNQ